MVIPSEMSTNHFTCFYVPLNLTCVCVCTCVRKRTKQYFLKNITCCVIDDTNCLLTSTATPQWSHVYLSLKTTKSNLQNKMQISKPNAICFWWSPLKYISMIDDIKLLKLFYSNIHKQNDQKQKNFFLEKTKLTLFHSKRCSYL